MYRIKNRRAIIDRKALVRDLDEQVRWGDPQRARDNTLQIFKAALYRGVGEVRRRFEEEKARGAAVVQADSYLVDQLIHTLYDFAHLHVYPIDRATAGEVMAVVATGGYGRGELSPFSDIDLMFLVADPKSTRTKAIVEYVLYLLWDLGLKVGHATRTVDDCVRLAKSDPTICTSLLESRWLCGDGALFQLFERRFAKDVVAGTGTQFVQTKLAERDARHERMGDTRYVLEPHVKEGKGGLRDLQTLFWIAKYLYQVKDMGELVGRGVFTEGDVRRFRRAQDFLWTVRCHLHYVTGRPEERLTFDVQARIGERLGYANRPGARGVERFMKHYYLVTKTVGDLTRVLCAVLEEEHKKPRFRLRLPSLPLFRRLPEGFRIDGGRLREVSDDAFAQDPVRLLRLFHEAQRRGLDIHPHTLRLVHNSLGLIDAAMRADPEANRLFMEMLTSENDPETTLRRLNEAGVFGRFMPDFGRVVAQMQYDMYHVYTVDEHSIRAIGLLHRIERGELAAEHPTATAVVGEIRSRRALYLAVLLHDIAKGRHGDHSEIGADIALALGPRLGLDDWETEAVSWLVRHHLLMSRFAFKRDMDDPKTVSDLTAVVQSPERLKMLLVLTHADISAVGPGIWNAWKAGLLRELFYRALEDIDMAGGQPAERRTLRVERAKARLRERLSDWPEAMREEFVARGYSDYWLAFDTDAHVRHFRLMREAAAEGRSLRIEPHQHPTRDITEFLIYAPDHAGLFARIAGAMALSGVSIVDAKIMTLANSMALDTFWVQKVDGGPVDSSGRIEKLSKRIEEAIVGRLHTARELGAVRARAMPTRTRVFKVPPAVFFDNKASKHHTVIEVNGRDRLGFLHDVTSTLTALGLQIVSAHISTYGERVVDVFYVKDVFGLKVEQQVKLKRIEERLLAAIEPPDAAGPPTPQRDAAQ
ncbi:MAG: [protein-PII] uridylyltransferase [Rhodospirillales bacterium]